jgi:antitoxin ParD1/3/4
MHHVERVRRESELVLRNGQSGNNTACAFSVIVVCSVEVEANKRRRFMNVSLGDKWEQFVASKVKSGDYQTASEVLRDGLRLLEKEALLKQISVGSLPELEAKLLKAAESLDAGKGVDGEQAFARLRLRSRTRRKNA